MERTLISQITYGKECKIAGWVKNYRNKKSMIFLVLKDISGEIQVTIEKEKCPEITEKLESNFVIPHSVVTFIGTAEASEYCKLGGREFFPTDVIINSVAEALPLTPDANVDTKMNYRWIDLRTDKNLLIFKIATDVEKYMREYLGNNDFIEIHTPKISGQSTEGGSEVFKLDYFGQPAYLTQSPQFYKQMAIASGFEKVFEFGDCFRAEQSFTARHATEFESFDIELGYIESHYDVMKMEEEIITYTLSKIKEKYGEVIKAVFDTDIIVPQGEFPKISYDDAVKIIEKEYGYKGTANDFDTECERYICKYAKEKLSSEFVFITEFPADQRAFYSMKCDENPRLTKTYDLLWKDVEITSGAEREHRADHLRQNIIEKGINPDNMQFYIDFFRYGCPAHGGYAIGMARFMAKLLNLNNIKEATFLFRGPTRLLP